MMGWREAMDAAMAAGLSPEDCEEPKIDPPTAVVVTVFRDEEIRWPDGTTEILAVPSVRSWPMFCEKAAIRFADWAKRKYGPKNVVIEDA